MPGTIVNAISTTVQVLRSRTSKVCKLRFNHRGSLQKLVQACLGTSKVCKRRFNHRGSLSKLEQACLDTGEVCICLQKLVQAYLELA